MSNRFIFLLVHLIIIYGLDVQGQVANLEKYWSYRDRLTSEFMVTGDQPGMSMPAERKDTAAGFLKWSDNTIWLGWYTGMLALEYSLLKDPRYPGYDMGKTGRLNQTLDELYYALKGMIRLDQIGESSFPPPCSNTGNIRNGFFLRDDVYSGFDSNFTGVNLIISDFNATDVYLKEMSQDQVYHLLMGLALVKKHLPAQLIVRGMNIRQEAIQQALLIIDWVNQDGWVIKNPVCQKSVDRGPDAFLLSHGINEAAKFFSDGTVDYSNDVTPFYDFAWSTLVLPSNPAYSNSDNLHMAMVIAAMGKGWQDTTLNVLMDLAVANRWYAYPLLDIVLHDDSTSPVFDVIMDTINHWSEQMMNEAPRDGPYTLYPNPVAHGYAVNNRFIRPRDTHYIGHFFTEGSQFNGLDFMMLFNLYNMVSPDKWPSQKIQINHGWNMISSYFDPYNDSMNVAFGEILANIIIVKNNAGDAYIPSLNINVIGNWEVIQGYKVKATQNTTLIMGGEQIEPTTTPIPLSPGWNMISYLRTSNMDITLALSGISNSVIIVKNSAGNTLIPSLSINTIGDMFPGQGYKIKVSNHTALSYPAN